MFEGQPSGTETTRRSTVVLTSRAPAEAARAVAAWLDWWDPDRVTTITPNPLAARALGVGYRSLADLALSSLVGRGLGFAGVLTRRAALQAAVEDSWGSPDAAGTARSVETTVRELLAAGAGAGNLAAVAGYPRLTSLIELVGAYRQRLAVDGLVDRAEALWLAAADGADGAPRAVPRAVVLLCGHSRLAPAEMAFLTSFAADGSLVVLPQAPVAPLVTAVTPDAFVPNEEAAAALAGRGWQVLRDDGVPNRSSATADPGPVAVPAMPRLSGYRLASLDAEVRFVLTAVKRLLLDGVPAASIALVAADPRAYGPAVVAVAREYGVSVRPTYTVPLTQAPLGYLVSSIAGVVSAGLPFEETARLLSHHLVSQLSGEKWTEARRKHPGGLGAWKRIDERVSLLDWPRRATRGEYAARLEATLAGLGSLEMLEREAPGRRHLELLSASLAAHAATRGSGTGQQADAHVSLAAFVGELLDHLQLVKVSRSGSAGAGTDGVALVTPAAVAGAAVSHLFVLGAAEGAIPARLEPGARLDFVEREAARGAGLPVIDATLAARSEALAFDGIVRAARSSLTLTFPESGERDGQLPSPYFASLGLVPVVPAARGPGNLVSKPAASIEELRRYLVVVGDRSSLAGDEVLVGARHALAVESRRESAEPPDEYDGVIDEPYPTDSTTFSATSLLALGQCTFKWFAQYALRLYEPEETEEELSPLVRGNLYHQALELAVAAARSAGEPTRETVLAALPGAFARAEEREARHTVNWQHHRGQHLAALERVIRAESFLPDGTEVVGTETRFGARHGSPATWRGFAVSGRIDRIDRRPGGLTLVDYKTSSGKPLGVQDVTGEAKVDLQLPIYLEAAVPALNLAGTSHGPGSAAAAAEYYSLTKSRVIATASMAGEDAFDRGALAAFADRAHAALAEGRYPVEPDRARRACEYCAFDAVCRVGPRVERKASSDG